MLCRHLWEFNMPAEYRFDVRHNLVLSYCVGPLIYDDMLNHQRRLREDPAFLPTMNQLADFGAVTELHLASAGVRQLSEASFFSATSRRAILVDDRDVLYGLARMFEILRDRGPEQISIFRNYPEAIAWLGLPPDYPRAVVPVK